jgi:hypothetical protein
MHLKAASLTGFGAPISDPARFSMIPQDVFPKMFRRRRGDESQIILRHMRKLAVYAAKCPRGWLPKELFSCQECAMVLKRALRRTYS